jgi:hypothetical protein
VLLVSADILWETVKLTRPDAAEATPAYVPFAKSSHRITFQPVSIVHDPTKAAGDAAGFFDGANDAAGAGGRGRGRGRGKGGGRKSTAQPELGPDGQPVLGPDGQPIKRK